MRARRSVLLAASVVASTWLLLAAGRSEAPRREPEPSATANAVGVGVDRGVPYARPAGRPLLADVYQPTGHRAAARPAVLLVHGGGWRAGERSWWHPAGVRLARRGWTAVTVDYRLAGESVYPAAVRDIDAAVDWLASGAATGGVPPTGVAVVGGSAGGHLALLAALRTPASTSAVVGVVAWSAPTDLVAARDTRALAPLVDGWLGCRSCPGRARAASPLAHASGTAPPVLLVSSDHELVPVAQARSLHDALRQAGASSELLVLPGTRHSAAYAVDAWPPTLRFLDRVLAAGG